MISFEDPYWLSGKNNSSILFTVAYYEDTDCIKMHKTGAVCEDTIGDKSEASEEKCQCAILKGKQ